MKRLLLILCLCASTVFAQDTTIISNATDIEDAWINSLASTTNYGSADSLKLAWSNFQGYTGKIWIRCLNVSDSLPADVTITEAKLRLWLDHQSSGDSVTARTVLMDAIEADVSWDNRKTTPDTAWYGGGVGTCSDFEPQDNTCCDARCYNMAPMGYGASNGMWVDVPFDDSLATGWYDGSMKEYGIHLIIRAKGFGNAMIFHSAEGDSIPQFMFVYTTAAAGPPDYVHGPDGAGVIHGASGSSKIHGP